VAFSPDGKRIVAGSHDQAGPKVWEAALSNEDGERRFHAWQQRQAHEYEESKDWFAAAFHLGAMLEREPKNLDIQARRDRALAELTKGRNGQYALRHNHWGNAHFANGDYDKAVADYSEAIRLNPQEAMYFHNRGNCYYRKGEFSKAADDQTKAIKIKPEFGQAWAWRGSTYAELGQWEKAAADFVKVTEFKEAPAAAWHQHALLRLQLGDRAGLQKCCTTMLQKFSRNHDDATAYFVALTCVVVPGAVEKTDLPLQLAEELVKKDPKQSTSLFLFGALLYRAGKDEEAVRRLNEAVEATNGGRILHWLFLALAHQRLGHADEARQWLGKAGSWIDKHIEKGQEVAPGVRISWSDRLMIQQLRQEAETVVGKSKR
jgi:tetratricopeptide (TPR) repeat protein